jgi:hypothetical protein
MERSGHSQTIKIAALVPRITTTAVAAAFPQRL